MSHFVLNVVIDGSNLPVDGSFDVGEILEKKLAPFSEHIQVERYREYEEGKPEDNWLYKALKRSAEEVANNDRKSIRPYKPNEIGWSSAFDTKRTEEQQWEDIKVEAIDFESFSNPPTWPEVIAYRNNKYYPDGPEEGEESEYMYYEPETDRAYGWSTYNPDSKWDWYQVGGRWSDRFPVRLDLLPAYGLVRGERSWTNREMPEKTDHVDGGPLRLLDLERMRNDKGEEAGKNWDKWHAFASQYPAALTMEELSATGNYETPAETRDAYWAQPLLAAKQEFGFQPGNDFFLWNGPSDFAATREEHVERARMSAVSGFATLTHENEWVEPGKMGWFGMSTDSEDDRISYDLWFNAYLDSLPETAVLIAVDCHI